MGIVNGLKQIWKATKNNTKNGLDHFWLREEGQKAIRDEVEKKFQHRIDLANRAESGRAANIKDLDKKLAESKDNWQKAQDQWKQDYDKALADAKNQRQTEISDYDTKLQGYQAALDSAKQGRQSIIDQLSTQEATYSPYKTIYIDVKTGDLYRLNSRTGKPENLDTYYQGLNKKEQRAFDNDIQNYDRRLFNKDTDHVINVFNEKDVYKYGIYTPFSNYLNRVRAPKDVALRDADDQIAKADKDFKAWQGNTRPSTLDEKQFKNDYKKNNRIPNEYNFNGQTYTKEADLDKAYKDALAHEQTKRSIDSKKASRYASERDAEIAQRIQDAKDINKVKVALGLGTAGALAGATYAAFSGDDNSNTKPVSPTVTPQTTEGIETQFEHPAETDSISGISPRDQEAALADMAFKAASESDDTPAETHPETPELAELSADDIHTNEGIGTRRSMNEGLFSVIKALQDPHQANAVADYIYSRYGNDPELQQLGWRAWLNKYYGDALRSQMNLDASGYNGMHIA